MSFPRSAVECKVAVVTALPLERVAVEALFDEVYASPPRHSNADTNAYGFGRMDIEFGTNRASHYVITCSLKAGAYGLQSAATVLTNLRHSFPTVQYIFMVGIAGGAPLKEDIRLGDVVIGTGAPLDYSMGRQEGPNVSDFHVNPSPVLFPSNPHLGSVLGQFMTSLRLRNGIGATFQRFVKKVPDGISEDFAAPYSRPHSADLLFKAEYSHNDNCHCLGIHETLNQSQFDYIRSHLHPRADRRTTEPRIFSGVIATANTVMKWAPIRDYITERYNVLCFEMEAGGVASNSSDYLVVRGICDYADSHKNKVWQEYAAATAAAALKTILFLVQPTMTIPPVITTSSVVTPAVYRPASSTEVRPLFSFSDTLVRSAPQQSMPVSHSHEPAQNSPDDRKIGDTISTRKLEYLLTSPNLHRIARMWHDARDLSEFDRVIASQATRCDQLHDGDEDIGSQNVTEFLSVLSRHVDQNLLIRGSLTRETFAMNNATYKRKHFTLKWSAVFIGDRCKIIFLWQISKCAMRYDYHYRVYGISTDSAVTREHMRQQMMKMTRSDRSALLLDDTNDVTDLEIPADINPVFRENIYRVLRGWKNSAEIDFNSVLSAPLAHGWFIQKYDPRATDFSVILSGLSSFIWFQDFYNFVQPMEYEQRDNGNGFDVKTDFFVRHDYCHFLVLMRLIKDHATENQPRSYPSAERRAHFYVFAIPISNAVNATSQACIDVFNKINTTQTRIHRITRLQFNHFFLYSIKASV